MQDMLMKLFLEIALLAHVHSTERLFTMVMRFCDIDRVLTGHALDL